MTLTEKTLFNDIFPAAAVPFAVGATLVFLTAGGGDSVLLGVGAAIFVPSMLACVGYYVTEAAKRVAWLKRLFGGDPPEWVPVGLVIYGGLALYGAAAFASTSGLFSPAVARTGESFVLGGGSAAVIALAGALVVFLWSLGKELAALAGGKPA